MQLILVLHNIRSVYNVGAILRTAEGLGVAKVVYSGYTPRYQDQTLLPHLRAKLDRQIEKSALGAEKMVKQESLAPAEVPDLGIKTSFSADSSRPCKVSETSGGLCLTKWLECATMERYTVVGLENNLSEAEKSRQILLGQFSAQTWQDLGEKVVLVLGEEVHGIPLEVREFCQYFLEIPMYGQKESFNVSVATGIAAWELLNGSNKRRC